jgi:molecular chaperone DnaJ
MEIKDYYQILSVEPSATLPEIKKAYRRLAQQFHPDKNPGNTYAAAQFADIKEAYEVLTDPSKKDYYLQQRWYNQSIGKRRTQDVITPVSVLKQTLELEKYVSKLDVFRMDKIGLQQYILDLLNDNTIEKLQKFEEPIISKGIISNILKCMQPLSSTLNIPIEQQLQKLSIDEETTAALEQFRKKGLRKEVYQKSSLLIVIAITILICVIIFLAGR